MKPHENNDSKGKGKSRRALSSWPEGAHQGSFMFQGLVFVSFRLEWLDVEEIAFNLLVQKSEGILPRKSRLAA